MRIAYVCADQGVPVFGRKGASVHVQEVVRALRRRGASVELFTPRPGGPPPADLADLSVRLLPRVRHEDPAVREQLALAANRALRGELVRRGPFDLVYERYSLWSWAALDRAATNGTPAVVEVNAPLIEEQARHRSLVDRGAAEEVAARVFRRADGVLAVSRPVAVWVGRWRERGVEVVPNGVDPARFPPRSPRSPGRFTVGFLGTLKPWHGVDGLIEAVAMLAPEDRRIRLLVVGDGPERGSLERAAREAGLGSRARFTGSVEPREVPGWLDRMDVGTAPYPELPRFYFSPLKLFEYMAAGLPVVAGRIGQAAEVVRDGGTGVLYPPGDPGALAAALAGLAASPHEGVRLGRAGRASVLRDHTWDAVAGRILRAAGLTRRGAA